MADQAETNQAEGPEILYQPTVVVQAIGGPDKHVSFATGEEAVMGMNGRLADFYGAEPGTFSPRASTLDFVVGATAACLLGTFRRALAARGVPASTEDLAADAAGDVVVIDGVPQLKRIIVHYRLTVPADADVVVIERAHQVHHRACAVSRSLESAIDIRTELELVQS
ncbi:MAG: OsmC family protein [Solirubrobacteraceae bacterium]